MLVQRKQPIWRGGRKEGHKYTATKGALLWGKGGGTDFEYLRV